VAGELFKREGNEPVGAEVEKAARKKRMQNKCPYISWKEWSIEDE